MYCTQCGFKMKDDDLFCLKCGKKSDTEYELDDEESHNIVDEVLHVTSTNESEYKSNDTSSTSVDEEDDEDSGEIAAGFALWRIVAVALYVSVVAYISITNPSHFMAELYWPMYIIPLTVYFGSYEVPWVGFFLNTIVTLIVASASYWAVYHYFSIPINYTDIINVYSQQFIDENSFFRLFYYVDEEGSHYTYIWTLVYIFFAPMFIQAFSDPHDKIIGGTSTNDGISLSVFIIIGCFIGVTHLTKVKDEELFIRYGEGLTKLLKQNSDYTIDKNENNYSAVSTYFLKKSKIEN